jgi:hypothetical protein
MSTTPNNLNQPNAYNLPWSPDTYSYTDPNGQQQTITVNYTTYTVQTNFGCSGIAEYGPTPNALVSSIVYPDGSSDSFTYEVTPGNPANVTGRVQSITLRTGGTITYAYNGSNDGINCSDGSTLALSRTTSDGTTSYSRTNVSGSEWQTVISYPPGSGYRPD